MVAWWIWNGVLVVIAYLLGSVSPGYLAGRWLQGIDIRSCGSGSTGATNVLRTLGKGPALAVLIVDVLKGVAAIALPRWVYTLHWLSSLAPETLIGTTQPWIIILAGLAALFGHSQPIWLNFKGGKSAATGFGVLLALSWLVALGTVLVFGTVLALFRIVSLSSLAAAIAAPLLMLLLNQSPAYQLFALLGSIYVIWRHRKNIQRLLTGSEPRISYKLLSEPLSPSSDQKP